MAKGYGKLESNPKKAHNRFSRYLSEQVKKVFFEANVSGDSKKQTYKGLRQLYAEVATQKAQPDDSDAYMALILGHGRQDLAANRKISDWATVQSYKSDWKVKA